MQILKLAKQNAAKKITLFTFIGLLFLTVGGCYYDYGMNVSDYDVVTTLYDVNFNFSNVKTYAMPDTIVHIVDEGKESDISRKYDSFILKQVASQMELRGITRITDPDFSVAEKTPNVVLLLRATSTTNYVAYNNYYWGGYWGWGWGGYYPWYGGTTVYNYTTGTVLIDMIDVENANPAEEEYPSAWLAAINGLLGDSGTSSQNRLSTSIVQAFVQSPYIGATE